MIDEKFAYLTDENGNKSQVLVYDELGNPIDWDEAKTKEAFEESQAR